MIDTMSAKLVVVQGRPAGKTLTFPDGVYYFGRGAECHVRPNSEWVSRQHCMLRVSGEGVFLRDLGSRNGTRVDGMRCETARLEPGSVLWIGGLCFQIVYAQQKVPLSLEEEKRPIP